MAEMYVPEDFSTTLLCMFFALLRETGSRQTVLETPLVMKDGIMPLGEILPLDQTTQVWMCRDLWSYWPGGGGATKDDEKFSGRRPDTICEDDSHFLLIENKPGRRRVDQEELYLEFLSGRKKSACFVYAVPEGWTINPDCEWFQFIRNPDRSPNVLRALIKWDGQLASTLCKTFNVPDWFQDKLPNKIGQQYL